MEPAGRLNILSEMAEADSRHAPATWQRQLADAIRDPDELCDLLQLDEETRLAARKGTQLFPLIVPRAYAQLIQPGDPNDPLLAQVLPRGAEGVDLGLPRDAVGDLDAARSAGLLQKYEGRVLFILTGACAVNCRFCFRRHFPYGEAPKGLVAWEPALAEIERDTSIEEVILSGGDPLAIADEWLSKLAQRLDAISHLKRLRIHTRFPVVIPERICSRLTDWLTMCRLQPILVLHINHPRELSPKLVDGVQLLVRRGILVLNQTVLLAGVNDEAATLIELSQRLVEARILPYYLHQLDRVQGVGHFEVAEAKGRALLDELRRHLPGYAVPRYVREIAGAQSKTVLS